ncbi:MAG: tripartite tricarboxylate transporter substrate binding protein [Betaproteobacteria bacterium]|jgi:tripartite-type tricarboxylate transporter receptor subunit TctC|nr:tripartite tricarboxylate transporter substrate binding protein [Betaproteobacteria bacterium]MDH5341797.1 tripartite tricarboxylate transporter substrate binding protein [Betaproteobacteria bacterium]
MKWLSGIAAVVSMALLFPAQAAQKSTAPEADYPTKPIRILVGFTPGGGPDITARYVAQKLTEEYKQQVIVDNRPGAGGTIAATLAANANPDGYTLLSVSSAHAVAPAIYDKLPYDARRDLAGITMSAVSKYVLVSAPSVGYKSLKDLLAAARAKPGALNFSSAGVGSGTHFAGELLKSMAKIDVVHIPFKGIPEAMTETITGRAQFFMSPIASAVGLVREGRLIGLGVSSLKRDALLPDVPTIAESGVPGYDSVLWFGLLTTSKTPRPLINTLNRDITRILGDAEAKKRWAPIGLDPAPTTAAEFDKIIAADIATFTRLAKAGNIKAQ